jgi:hypothetical protein
VLISIKYFILQHSIAPRAMLWPMINNDGFLLQLSKSPDTSFAQCIYGAAADHGLRAKRRSASIEDQGYRI